MTDIQKENKSGGKVPNLRFPNFEGVWEVKKLGEICEMRAGKFIVASEIYDKPNDSLFPCFGGNGLRGYTKSFNKEGTYSLIGRQGALCGNVTLANGKFYATEHAVIVEPNENADTIWMFYLLTYLNLNQYATGMAQPGLSVQNLEKIEIVYPKSKKEQQKTASFLSKIDERIQTQSKIIKGLKKLKVATAKKIFSQELRFKDNNGNEFPEWEEVLLGDALDYEQPTNYLVSSTEYDDSFETPVVTAGKTFILGYTDEKNGVFEKEKLPVIIFDDFTTASQFVDFSFKAKSSAMKILKAKNGTNIRFIFEALQMINYEVGGHGRHWISVFSNLSISVPSLPEQTKIANFLSAIDFKIDIENQLLQKLEEQKKFLLQNIFV
ncbi:restriction endonuclease subunit S [Soonwooa sp.]|uniref:restriction endonuclease subunit S n=1 Tax=Soonwooa sp. TaxID=1938592 RepID=UPI0028A6266C|nr:restriction endonuclease subunit S [Soonwooa sp.]